MDRDPQDVDWTMVVLSAVILVVSTVLSLLYLAEHLVVGWK
jgi:hypothetical protein